MSLRGLSVTYRGNVRNVNGVHLSALWELQHLNLTMLKYLGAFLQFEIIIHVLVSYFYFI